MNQSTYKLIVTLLVLVIVIGGGMLLYRNLGQNIDLGEAIPTETAPQNLAPDFTVTDGEGNEVKLSDFRGKGVVLNFWASWCGPCKMEMPDFNEKYLELGDKVQFLMVGITDGSRDTVEKASGFIAQTGYQFPVFYDTDLNASNTYRVSSIPTTYFIDARGNVLTRAVGMLSAAGLQSGIDLILPTAG